MIERRLTIGIVLVLTFLAGAFIVTGGGLAAPTGFSETIAVPVLSVDETQSPDGNYALSWTGELEEITVSGTLPSGRDGTSAVWDGQYAYIFGGWSSGEGDLNEIVRYNPATDVAITMTETLPSGRWGTIAVWDGQNAYIFGGASGGFDEIVRYDPTKGAVTTMNETLPNVRFWTSAVWDGQYAYIFGGEGSNLGEIVRYDPATGAVTTMTETLPSGGKRTSAIWDGQNAYLFGGWYESSLDKIVRYDPNTGAVTTINETLPSGRIGTSAAWDGQYAYIFGGGGNLGEIVRYDPATEAVTTMTEHLPSRRYDTSAVWIGQYAYIFGGRGTDWSYLDEIVRYRPPSFFELEEASDAGFTSPVTLFQGDKLNHTLSGQLDGSYYYRVRVDGGNWGNTIQVTVAIDTDGDGFGDNATGSTPDGCVREVGTSYRDRYGCPDEDQDGKSDLNDPFPEDRSQWNDTDADGYGDNQSGTFGDACPGTSGTSTIDRFGCPDRDGDGISDKGDWMPWMDNTIAWTVLFVVTSAIFLTIMIVAGTIMGRRSRRKAARENALTALAEGREWIDSAEEAGCPIPEALREEIDRLDEGWKK